MGLFETPIPIKKYRADKIASRLNHIRELADIPLEHSFEEQSPIFNLGTMGGGNHFAEFQTVNEVRNEQAFHDLGVDKKQILLLIHCGSRDYGQRIINSFPGYDGLSSESDGASDYLSAHDDALVWARRNRFLVAQKLIRWLGYGLDIQPVLDCHHNYVEKRADLYVHRKGAISALNGPVIIPGSRGSLTYLVMPASDTSYSAFSLSHGAGRKWARSLCKSRIRNKYDRNNIRQNPFGGRVVCHDTDLLFQEAPEAYKNIEHVIASLEENNLCSVIATLKPLLTYKG
jgi:release factor H-coupled RctB family protein